MVSEYRVLYTHQKKKKSKVWQDGTMIFNKQGVKGTLLSEDGQTLDVIFTRHHCIGDELESDRYLVTIEEKIGSADHQKQIDQAQQHTNYHYTRHQLCNKRPHSPDYSYSDRGAKRSVSQILGLLYPGAATSSSNVDQSLSSPSPSPQSNVFTLYPDMTSSSSCVLFPPAPMASPQLSEEQSTVPLQQYLLPGHQMRSAAVPTAAAASGLVSSHTVERRRSPEGGRWRHYIDTPVEAVTAAGYWCPSSPPPLPINHHAVVWNDSETCGEQPLPSDTSFRRPPDLFPRSSAYIAVSMPSQNTISSNYSKEATLGANSSLPNRLINPSPCTTSLTREIMFINRPVSSVFNKPDTRVTEFSSGETPSADASVSFQQWQPATSPSSTVTTSALNITTSFLSKEATCTTADQQLFYRKLRPITVDPSEFTNRHYHSPIFSSNTPPLLLHTSQIPTSKMNELMTNSLSSEVCSPQRLGEVSQIVLNDSLELSDDDGPALPTTAPCADDLILCAVSSEDEEPVRNRSDFKLGLWEFSSDSEP